MLINGVDLSVYGAKLYDRVISSNSIDTTSEWLDGDIQPTFVRQQDRFKNMTVSFLILGQNEDDAFLRMSKLTAAIKRASLKFDDLDYTFDVVMNGSAQQDRLKNGNFVVTYTLKSDYAKGDREVYTTDANSLNSFKLTVVYYQNNTTILATESVDIRASKFEEEGTTLATLGIDLDKYRPNYYDAGVATNLGGNLTYEGLKELQVLIINYTPTKYNIEVRYYYNNGNGVYSEILTKTTQFTYPQLSQAQSIGQIIDATSYKPEGCKTTIDYSGPLTVESILSAAPIDVFYDAIENEKSKTITLTYTKENSDGSYSSVGYTSIVVKESDIVEGMTYRSIFNVDGYRPNITHYDSGELAGDYSLDNLITFDNLQISYEIRYRLTEHITYVEYYAGIYPNWYRITSVPVRSKYSEELENNFSLAAMGIDIDKYHTPTYENGVLYNADNFTTYDAVLAAGILQIYYPPIDYPIVIQYFKDTPLSEPIATEEIEINELMFLGNPVLNDIIDVNKHRPEGYQLDTDQTYNGEISLSALTQASPIRVVYEEIEEVRAKNIILKYKKTLSSGLTVINTSLIVVNEADCLGGVRLRDIINVDAYKPEYYESGYIDGFSSTALITFDELKSSYDIIYLPTTYYTPVRYYTDDVDQQNWIGSSNISYKIIDFTTSTTLYDLGLDVNMYKPSYCDDGVVQYTGPVNFTALLELEAIEVVYETIEEPDDGDDIDYPHRFLFLQHNDLKDYENLFPNWTMNHSFINTGVTAEDMSKLTVIMECGRVDKNVPLHEVNAGYAALFGSISSQGEFYMRFNNQTQYGNNLTGVNTYEAKAGKNTNKLTLTEENAVGFSENTGIYASERAGYSYATFTYSNNLQTENAPIIYPIYLFAENSDGHYANGLAGIGIYGARIYYDNVLIRDFVPVAFYDIIGTQVAPENCLYDKITKTFYIDGSGTSSFNIIDDDRYEDTNPEHKIGHCYVNYYKGENLFQTLPIYFRASDFIDQTWDLYDKFGVDKYQPQYYSPGVIVGFENIDPTFDGLNNQIFSVVYEEQIQTVIARYYKDNILFQTDEIPLTEKDFYQAPTFGDIVRLNKYKPDGYETNFVYPDTKVSLNRVLAHSPYDIYYVPETDTSTYTTQVRYMKETFTIREYQTIATDTVTLKASDFRDGEYIDYHIDLNAHKPERFFNNGERYGWYAYDERISTPDMLKPEYQILYRASSENINIHYYKKYPATETEEERLEEIATTTWIAKITDFEGEFTIVDMLPNEYVNKFRPINCYSGEFLHPEKVYTFETLVDDDDVSIVYEVRYTPEEPDDESWANKVLVWGRVDRELYLDENSGKYDIPKYLANIEETIANLGVDEELKQDLLSMYNNQMGIEGYIGGRIPYIDLGYTTKQINRLRVEMKCYVQSEAFKSQSVTTYGYQTEDYLYFFGYYGPRYLAGFGDNNALGVAQDYLDAGTEWYSVKQNVSPSSAGYLAFKAYVPTASGYVYTCNGPQTCEGQTFYSASQSSIAGNPGIANIPTRKYVGIYMGFRQGYYYGTDINWNEYVMNKNYEMNYTYEFPWNSVSYIKNGVGEADSGYLQLRPTSDFIENNRRGCVTTGWLGGLLTPQENLINGLANPYYLTLDAYNGYGQIYTEETDYSPQWVIFDTSEDDDAFEGRPEVKGSISLFQTRNPSTGEINIMPFEWITYPSIASLSGAGGALQNPSNPYDPDYSTEITYSQLVITGTTDAGEPIYETQIRTRNVKFANYPVPVNPQLSGAAVWNIKIYDRDRLVRDLIPMAKGDKVYDYVAPANGLFDKVTEIFFTNSNEGGVYEDSVSIAGGQGDGLTIAQIKRTIDSKEVLPLMVIPDPVTYGKCAINYYDYDNSYIDTQLVDVPTWYSLYNTNVETILRFNDHKPGDFYTNGMVDLDMDLGWEEKSLQDIYEDGAVNIYYKLKTFTKSIIYYNENVRIGSKDVFFSLEDIKNATTLDDLGLDVDLYWTENFQHGKIYFDEAILAEDDMQAFIDAPAPIIVYHKWSKEERPDLFYVEYYRGGASDESDLIWKDEENPNYLNCNLDAKVLNVNGCVQYANHYHSALYEDEEFDYFIPYQVKVVNRYCGIHNGPGRKYKVLANIVDQDIYTITEERAGWGRLKEYPLGWIDLTMTEEVKGEGELPDYEVPELGIDIIPFKTEIHLTRLTIDRLWAYTDTYNCWVKTEEISYNQAGRLYNGLGIEVIDLSAIDFSTVSTLADMKIYPQLYKLYYHEPAEVTYTGPWTYEAFAEMHNIEFIYNETLYSLTCLYKFKEEELATAALSYSISDWNPDWEYFIATSFQYDEDDNPIPPTLYRDTPLELTWGFLGMERDEHKPAGTYGLYVWNPYPWDIRNDKVTFQDIIGTGSQTVEYIDGNWDMYNMYRATIVTRDDSTRARFSLGKFVMAPESATTENPMNVDLTVGFKSSKLSDGSTTRPGEKYYKTTSVLSDNRYANKPGLGDYIFYEDGPSMKAPASSLGIGKTKTCGGGITALYNIDYSTGTEYFTWGPGFTATLPEKYTNLEAAEIDCVVNVSNFRDKSQAITGVKYYKDSDYEFYEDEGKLIRYNSKLTVENKLHVQDPPSDLYHYTYITDMDGYFVNDGIQYIALYKSRRLDKLFVPVPGGYKDLFDQVDVNQTFRDPLNGSMQTGFEYGPYRVAYNNRELGEAPENIYDDKTYTPEVFEQLVTYSDSKTYKSPTTEALEDKTLRFTNAIIPIRYKVDDSTEDWIKETWYSTNRSNLWIQASKTSLYSIPQEWKITYYESPVSIMCKYGIAYLEDNPGNAGPSPYVYRQPVDSSAEGDREITTAYVSQYLNTKEPFSVMAECYNADEDMSYLYIPIYGWFKKENTTLDTKELNKNYVVTQNNVYSYAFPSLKAEKSYPYYLGDRVTGLYTTTAADGWVYVGNGWMQESVLSEIL